jgi:hypothetical protein
MDNSTDMAMSTDSHDDSVAAACYELHSQGSARMWKRLKGVRWDPWKNLQEDVRQVWRDVVHEVRVMDAAAEQHAAPTDPSLAEEARKLCERIEQQDSENRLVCYCRVAARLIRRLLDALGESRAVSTDCPTK